MTVTLRLFAVLTLLAWSPACAQTKCQPPPPGMSCPGDRLVWCNTPSGIYHFQGERYFGCTKTGKFQCQQEGIVFHPLEPFKRLGHNGSLAGGRAGRLDRPRHGWRGQCLLY